MSMMIDNDLISASLIQSPKQDLAFPRPVHPARDDMTELST